MDYSFFYLLFYSFILESLPYYSFHSTYYSFNCRAGSEANNRDALSAMFVCFCE